MLELIAAVVSFPFAVVLMFVLVATSKTVSDYVHEVSRGEILILCWIVVWASIVLIVSPHI